MDLSRLGLSNLDLYKYRALSTNLSIRLLEVHKAIGHVQGQSTFSLVEAPLNNNVPIYFALSYAWEGQKTSEYIEIVGIEDSLQSTKLGIAKNVGDALRRLQRYWFKEHELRNDVGYFAIWIDAVCIDQGNIVERGQQVAMMDEIYRRANSVYVWLGCSNDVSDKVMRQLRYWEELHELLRKKEVSNEWIRERFFKRFIDFDGAQPLTHANAVR
jgi:hypothetical protein